MELSGGIQVLSGTCHGVDVLVFRGEGPFEDLWVEGKYPDDAMRLFEAEVLRIKEAPHGTDAE